MQIIVTYSLDTEASRKIIDQFVRTSGFVLREPDQGFIQTLEVEVNIVEPLAYAQCRTIAEMLCVEFEKAFGTVRYANFLINYKGIPQTESFRTAAERFGLPQHAL